MQTKLYGIIYLARSASGKAYIGQTTLPLKRRIASHLRTSGNCRLFAAALKKYDNQMQWQTLACASNPADLNFAERALIAQHRTLAPDGYNLTTGGDSGGKMSPQSVAKLSAAIKRSKTPDVIQKQRDGAKRYWQSDRGQARIAAYNAAASDMWKARVAKKKAARLAI